MKDTDGNVIAAENYTLQYANNTNVGTGSVTVAFTGDRYEGSKVVTFEIVSESSKTVASDDESKSKSSTSSTSSASPTSSASSTSPATRATQSRQTKATTTSAAVSFSKPTATLAKTADVSAPATTYLALIPASLALFACAAASRKGRESKND